MSDDRPQSFAIFDLKKKVIQVSYTFQIIYRSSFFLDGGGLLCD
jgi:hypothetical protein